LRRPKVEKVTKCEHPLPTRVRFRVMMQYYENCIRKSMTVSPTDKMKIQEPGNL